LSRHPSSRQYVLQLHLWSLRVSCFNQLWQWSSSKDMIANWPWILTPFQDLRWTQALYATTTGFGWEMIVSCSSSLSPNFTPVPGAVIQESLLPMLDSINTSHGKVWKLQLSFSFSLVPYASSPSTTMASHLGYFNHCWCPIQLGKWFL
jgi:hypothetical protein